MEVHPHLQLRLELNAWTDLPSTAALPRARATRLYLALARLPFSFRTVNLKTGVQRPPEYLAVNRAGVVP